MQPVVQNENGKILSMCLAFQQGPEALMGMVHSNPFVSLYPRSLSGLPRQLPSGNVRPQRGGGKTR